MIRREGPISIEIPEREQNEVVEVFLDNLPDNAEQISSIIIDEEAPVELFLRFAIEYYWRQNSKTFYALLDGGLRDSHKRSKQNADTRRTEVTLLATLAAYEIARGLRKRSAGEDEKRSFEEATMAINRAADRQEVDEGLLLRKGLLLLCQDKGQAAEYQFSMVLAKNGQSAAAHAGLAAVYYARKEWERALASFQMVLKRVPSCGDSVRLLIGHCLVQLNLPNAAATAFERVLQQNPENREALLALALLMINGKNPSKLAQGMQFLKRAFELDRSDPVALTQLANHFFFKKELSKALSLATSAVEAAQSRSNPFLQADAHWVLGKVHQVEGRWEEAFQCYSHCVRLNPNMALGQFGLGQMFLQREDYRSALGCFERAMAMQAQAQVQQQKTEDPTVVALHGLTAALLYSANDPKAIDPQRSLQSAAEQAPEKAFCIWLALASLFEQRSELGEALMAMTKARALDPAMFTDELLLNNYAVLLHANGKTEQAEQIFSQLQESSPVIRFNQARLAEDQGKLEHAEKIYRSLLKASPSDTSLHLRLGLISTRRNQLEEAVEHYKEAIGIDPKSIDAWSLLANNQLRLKAMTPARKSFERILKEQDKHDPFALVSLGHIHLESAHHERHRNDALWTDHIKRALEFFTKSLQLQPHNHCAAMGIAIALAETGRWSEAKDAFLLVRQATASANQGSDEASLNLAHCFVELGQFTAAIHGYEQALVDCKSKRHVAQLRLYLARALYAQGKTERRIDCFEQALQHLHSAMQLYTRNEENTPLTYNVALCQQELASTLLKLKVISDDQVLQASAMLQSASKTFTELAEQASLKKEAPLFDLAAVKQRAKYCQTMQTSLQQRSQKIHQAAQQRSVQLERLKDERQSQEAMADHRRREREMELQEMREQDDKLSRELAQRLKETELRFASEIFSDQSDQDDQDDQDRHDVEAVLEEVSEKKRSKRQKIISDEDPLPITSRRSRRAAPQAPSKDIISSSDNEGDS